MSNDIAIASAKGKYGVAVRDHPADHPKVIAAKRELHALNLEKAVREIVESWPPLNEEQLDRIATLLRPTQGGRAA